MGKVYRVRSIQKIKGGKAYDETCFLDIRDVIREANKELKNKDTEVTIYEDTYDYDVYEIDEEFMEEAEPYKIKRLITKTSGDVVKLSELG